MTIGGPCEWNIGGDIIYIPCGKSAAEKDARTTGRYGAYTLTGPWPGARCFNHRWEGLGDA